jgi:hypothetical protein
MGDERKQHQCPTRSLVNPEAKWHAGGAEAVCPTPGGDLGLMIELQCTGDEPFDIRYISCHPGNFYISFTSFLQALYKAGYKDL